MDCGNIKSNQMEKFKYIGMTPDDIKEDREKADRARVNVAWDKWNRCSGVICDKGMPRKQKVIIYRTLRRGQDFCWGGIRPRRHPGMHQWCTRWKLSRESGSAVSRVMDGVPKRNKNSKKR